MSNPAPRTRRERVEAREEAILAAAHDIFAEKGFTGAKVADIARRAEVAEGTLYLYFRNKSALLEAVISDFYAHLTRGAQHGVERLAGTFDRLDFLARHHLSECLTEWRILELMIGHYRAMPEYEDRGYRQLNRTYVAVFDNVIREGINRGELRDDIPLWQVRDLFYGTLEYSARTLKLRGEGQEDFDAVVTNAVAMLRRGIQRQTGGAEPNALLQLDAIARRLEKVAGKLEGAD